MRATWLCKANVEVYGTEFQQKGEPTAVVPAWGVSHWQAPSVGAVPSTRGLGPLHSKQGTVWLMAAEVLR